MPRRKRIKKCNLFETLPQDSINELASYLEYKQLTKLRVNKQMNLLIEMTPAGKKARAANILEDEIKDIDQINRYNKLFSTCLLSSSVYIHTSLFVYGALINSGFIAPELNVSQYLVYNAIDASMGAIFAAGFRKMLSNYYLEKDCTSMRTMAMGALATYCGIQGGYIGIKSAEVINHIAHLPKQLQYASADLGYVIGLGLGESIAANLGFFALTRQYGFSFFKEKENHDCLSRQARNIRLELSARKM